MSVALQSFFKGKRVLVTGHTGFKGSWLSLWLLELGATVIGLSLEPEKESLFEQLGLAEQLVHEIGDIRDFDCVKRVFKIHQPEVVLHLAAQPLVRASYDSPIETYATNVMGTVHVLQACRETASVQVIVNVTTDKCYENKEWVFGYREVDPLGGYDPYSSSKACSELVTAAYRSSFLKNGPFLASARAGNVIGGGDWAMDRLIPDCIRSLRQGKPIIIRNPLAIRPWQHVLEPLSGYLWLACRLGSDGKRFAGAWNMGPLPTGAVPVKTIVSQVIDTWGSGAYEVIPDGEYHEMSLLELDVSKAIHHLGWIPTLSVEEAVSDTVSWYYEQINTNQFHAKKRCLEQIDTYTGLAAKKGNVWAI